MSKYKGKKILVVGFGKSGASVARFLAKQGAKVMVTDMKQKNELTESVNACSDLKIEYDLGKFNSKTFTSAELIVLSPGIALTTKPLDEAKAAGIPIVSEIEIACGTLQAPLVAITGTNGKTTTTSLIGEMFKAAGKPVFIGGNIGKPLVDYANEDSKAEVVVAEISSFQLDMTEKMVPAVAVFTNLEEDHMDRYSSVEAYFESKKKLLKFCDRSSYVVLNFDHPLLATWARESPGKVIWFTKQNPMQVGGEFAENFVGCYLNSADKKIIGKFGGKEENYDVSKIRIFGEHNKENLMAAICAARIQGVSPAAIQKTIDQFPGVEHRLEFVKKHEGVFIFNDSKATNVMSVVRSLSSFPSNPIILIAGGKDKNAEFSPLNDLVKKRVKIMILVGEAKEKINRAIGDLTETFLVGTFEEAVLMAFQKSRRGDIILLSPGCASFDMFRNFEERGDYFKKLVKDL